MFETREKEDFNPLEEKYRYYAMLFSGLYSIPSEHVEILVAGMGLFGAIMMLARLLQGKVEVEYFNKLYKEYINEMYSIGRPTTKLIKLVEKTLDDFLKNNGAEKLNTIVKEFINAKDDLLK